jgi:DAACS family dicarboxylate/amino acid:cation (Na+ or H+) symporter
MGLDTNVLGQLGMLVIRFLKALAVPLILFSILDSFLREPITARAGGRVVVICLINVSVAFVIGLTLMNLLQPGLEWRGRLEEMATRVGGHGVQQTPQGHVTLDPLTSISGMIPQSLLEPVMNNNVLSVVLLAIVFGLALSSLKRRQGETDTADIRPLEDLIRAIYYVLLKVLSWTIEIMPLAVFGLIAQVVGRTGIGVFSDLAGFFGIILLGLCLQALVYYPLAAWSIGGIRPKDYFKLGFDAILTGLSANSSLAAVPVTLRCLKKMQVSDGSARLAVCAGTNLNNDGITLYEAMAALFLAQAVGFDLGSSHQAVIVLSAMMAGMGIAGIPEAGLVMLPLVLSAAGLPEMVVASAIPLIAPVDWILARVRSGVNVMSDLLVAILLDSWAKRDDK